MVYTWLIVGIVIFVIFVTAFKSQDLLFVFTLIKKYMFTVIILAIFLLFAFSITKITGEHNIDLTSGKGIVQAFGVYLGWIKAFFVNLASFTGNVVNQNWFEANSSVR